MSSDIILQPDNILQSVIEKASIEYQILIEETQYGLMLELKEEFPNPKEINPYKLYDAHHYEFLENEDELFELLSSLAKIPLSLEFNTILSPEVINNSGSRDFFGLLSYLYPIVGKRHERMNIEAMQISNSNPNIIMASCWRYKKNILSDRVYIFFYNGSPDDKYLHNKIGFHKKAMPFLKHLAFLQQEMFELTNEGNN